MIFHFSKIMTSTAKVRTQKLLKYVRRGPNFFPLFASLAAFNTTNDGMSVVRFRFKRKELRLVCNACPHCLRLLLLEYVYFCHKTLKEEIKKKVKKTPAQCPGLQYIRNPDPVQGPQNSTLSWA